MTDASYDELSKRVQSQIRVATGNHRMDRFFLRHFNPDTGLWVHAHPDRKALERIYVQVWYPKLYAESIKRNKRRRRKRERKNR